eukprot:scaffold15697_cov40-Cyclotella_meneghiniana.AAC.12
MVDNDDSYWCDHPINDRDDPEYPTFEQIDSLTKSPEEAPSKSPEEANTELGHSADGRSCRLRNLVSLGDKQVPAEVCLAYYSQKVSHKCLIYKKRIADRRRKADA